MDSRERPQLVHNLGRKGLSPHGSDTERRAEWCMTVLGGTRASSHKSYRLR